MFKITRKETKEVLSFLKDMCFILFFIVGVITFIFGIPVGIGFGAQYLASYMAWSNPCAAGIVCGGLAGGIEVIILFFWMITSF
jgi:hypothetical protein